MSGAAKRIERERLFLEVNAWQTAHLTMIGYHKPKKFPEFKKISSTKVRPKRQSWEEQKAIAQAFNAAFGGEVE
ncbi:hypothetical protein [Pacificoceanicola onchidii]|uniref:hypothetical protein n=1 Tax=Pacificoceanicola onchidii TaxID=2562685 RepID=UPI0010A3713D|nr:hypothetical protein [Pacificoceanicola onchidii]